MAYFLIFLNSKGIIFLGKYHKIYKKPLTKYHYKHILGVDSIFIIDGKFRNLFAKFILIKDEGFAKSILNFFYINSIMVGEEDFDDDLF